MKIENEFLLILASNIYAKGLNAEIYVLQWKKNPRTIRIVVLVAQVYISVQLPGNKSTVK